ncbi:hypothetical protein R0J90_18130, partial [Micrococcus sp. SIMBA_144]
HLDLGFRRLNRLARHEWRSLVVAAAHKQEKTMTLDINSAIDDLAPAFAEISNKIWGFAELQFDEVNSSALQAETLEKTGFQVTRNV